MEKSLSVQKNELPLEVTPALMLHAFLERGGDNIEVAKEMFALYERMEAKSAEKEFAAAFVALQSQSKSIKALKEVKNNDGTSRYFYAPYEEIMESAQPLLAAHGFAVSFDTAWNDARITVTCTLTHKGGHSRPNSFAVRVGKGPPGSSETQADGSAKSYAKRGALCDALNITVDRDDDGRAQGGAITPEQAASLESRVKKLNANEKVFLKFAGAASFEEIGECDYARCDEFLAGHEKKKFGAPTDAPKDEHSQADINF